MTTYTIHAHASAPVSEVVPTSRIAGRIDELSGRSIAGYILRTWSGSAYVATNRDSIGRGLYGRGFIVKRADRELSA
jgi:hypothetical protein